MFTSFQSKVLKNVITWFLKKTKQNNKTTAAASTKIENLMGNVNSVLFLTC